MRYIQEIFYRSRTACVKGIRTAVDFAELSRTQIAVPVLSIGGEKANGAALGAQVKLVAPNVKVIVLKDTGHWILEERPEETIAALVEFLQ